MGRGARPHQVHVIDATDPVSATRPVLVHRRQTDVQCFVEHTGRSFYAMTTLGAPDGYVLLKAPTDCPPHQLPRLEGAGRAIAGRPPPLPPGPG